MLHTLCSDIPPWIEEGHNSCSVYDTFLPSSSRRDSRRQGFCRSRYQNCKISGDSGHDTLHDWITRTTQSSVLERIQQTQNANLSATKTKSQNAQGFGCYPRRKRTGLPVFMVGVYGQINVYDVTIKSERHKRSYWTRTADGNSIGGRKAPVPYGS